MTEFTADLTSALSEEWEKAQGSSNASAVPAADSGSDSEGHKSRKKKSRSKDASQGASSAEEDSDTDSDASSSSSSSSSGRRRKRTIQAPTTVEVTSSEPSEKATAGKIHLKLRKSPPMASGGNYSLFVKGMFCCLSISFKLRTRILTICNILFLVFSVVGCDQLDSKDSNGLSDPFVKLKLGDVKRKTNVIKKTLVSTSIIARMSRKKLLILLVHSVPYFQ